MSPEERAEIERKLGRRIDDSERWSLHDRHHVIRRYWAP
jgi:hypothetical protein